MKKKDIQDNLRAGTNNKRCHHCGKNITGKNVYVEWLMRKETNAKSTPPTFLKLLSAMHMDCAVKAGKLVKIGNSGIITDQYYFKYPEGIPEPHEREWAKEIAKTEGNHAREYREIQKMEDPELRQLDMDELLSGIVGEANWSRCCSLCGNDFQKGDLFIAPRITSPPFDLADFDIHTTFESVGKDCGCAKKLGLDPPDWTTEYPVNPPVANESWPPPSG